MSEPPAKPRLYTIPAGENFAGRLAAALIAETAAEPLRLSDYLILLPNRRSARSLREAFLRQGGGRPLLLPRMRAIGDVDEDDLALSGLLAGAELALPPAVSPLARQLLLAPLIQRWAELEAEPKSPAQAVALAAELAWLIDQAQTEGPDFKDLPNLVTDENLSIHWRQTLLFLRIITEQWPLILQQTGRIDPVDRHNRLLAALAERWRADPPAYPVIAAGFTGPPPAIAEMVALAARLPAGRVVLPGLDIAIDDASWDALAETHPQFGLKQLLERIRAARAEVDIWPGCAAASPRARLLADALRPAETTAGWRGLAVSDHAAEGLYRIDAPGPREEAGAIALALRQALETPGRTAALVTPDRALARRVAAELRRWNIDIDDSAGLPLAETPPGVFLRLVARLAAGEIEPVPLLAVLKHPLAAAGSSAAECRALARRVERAALRGPRPAPGWDGLRAELKEADLRGWIDGLEAICARFRARLAQPDMALRDLVTAHVECAEGLARTASLPGSDILWAGDAGQTAAGFIAGLLDAADSLPPLAGADYPALFETLLADPVARPRYGRHPRLSIWGAIEARLQSADVLVLGGLNENVWPAAPPADPWMSRPMRAAFGLPAPETRIGQAAHDFLMAAAAPTAILTRSAKTEGAPTVPSRWLLRLDAVLGESRPLPAGDWLGWFAALNRAAEATPAPPPAPRPPLSARPRTLSATRIATLMRDPYSIYARYILALKPLDALDAPPDASDRGDFVHRALEKFIDAFPHDLPPDALDRLLRMGEAVGADMLRRPAVRAFWWPRFVRVAEWFVEAERRRRQFARPIATEASGEWTFDAPGGPFKLIAVADRIDRMDDGRLAILDYKTGTAPNGKEVATGRAPQLPLEALIARAGGFARVPAAEIGELAYWRLTGGREPGEIRLVPGAKYDLADVLAQAEDGLRGVIAEFDNPGRAYDPMLRPAKAQYPGDYDHLARLKEWAGDGDGDDGGDGGGEA